jgi:cell division protein FtsN
MDDATSLDRSEGSATASLYRAAIGSINTGYYERVFTRFEEKDRSGPSWNWAAALITLNWMAFRKLWGAVLAYAGAMVAAALLVLGIGRLVLQLPADAEWLLLAALALLSVAIPGVYGNAMLHAACRKRMVEALATTATVEEACAVLQTNVVTVKRMLVIALINLALAGLCFAVYHLIPDANHMPMATTRMDAARTAPMAPKADAAAPAASAIPAAAPASSPAVPPSAPASSGVSALPPAVPASASAQVEIVLEANSSSAAPPSTPPAPVAEAPIVQSPKAPEKPKKAKVPTEAVAAKTYFINVGLFADQNNALNAYTRLTDAGVTATKGTVKGPRGTFTRVRAGPYATQAEADKAAETIRSLKLDAVVVAP